MQRRDVKWWEKYKIIGKEVKRKVSDAKKRNEKMGGENILKFQRK